MKHANKQNRLPSTIYHPPLKNMPVSPLRLLYIAFSLDIAAYEIPQFRKAVAKKVGFEHDLFHNHRSDGRCIHRYPLIQYKRRYGKASILCLNEGIEALRHLLYQKDWSIQLNGSPQHFSIDDLQFKEFDIATKEGMPYTYFISNWIAFNAQNHQKYQEQESMLQRLLLLQRLLRAHILSFTKGIQQDMESMIEVEIIELKQQRMVLYKDNHYKAFSLSFRSNLFLPYGIGIGKAASHGYGILRRKI